ncbi:nucleotidyltransferase/DNA polymerase involved in DNA repair [Bradyrhizobium sp. GM24.11]
MTENLQSIPLARDVALAIRAKIKEVTGLSASAGISYNKFLAKLASDYRKPNGQYVITPEMGPAFVEALPVGKFHGIGPATSAKMNSLGLHTGLDMRNQSLEFMQTNFGKAGSYYYWISRGVDNREVRADRIRKSVGRRKHVLHRPYRLRRHGRRTRAAHRQGLATLRRHQQSREDGDVEGQVQRLRDRHAQPILACGHIEPSRARTRCYQPAKERDAGPQAHPASGRLAVGIAACRRHGTATCATDVNRVTGVELRCELLITLFSLG